MAYYGPMPVMAGAVNPGKYGFGVTKTGKSRTKPLGSRRGTRPPSAWNNFVSTFTKQHAGQYRGGPRGALLKAASAAARAQGVIGGPRRSPPRSRRAAAPVYYGPVPQYGRMPVYGGF